MKGVRKSTLALVAATIVAALIAVSSYGIAIPLLPFTPVPLDGPVAADSNGKMTAIADSQSRRILVLNDRDELNTIINFDALNAPVEAVTDVSVHDGEIYVSGLCYEADSSIIRIERVLIYDEKGAFKKIAFEYKPEDGEATSIKSLCEMNDGVMAVVNDGAELTLSDSTKGAAASANASGNAEEGAASYTSLVRVNARGAELKKTEKGLQLEIMDAGCTKDGQSFVTTSIRGVLNDLSEKNPYEQYAKDHVFATVDIADDKTIYVADGNAKTTYRIDGSGELKEVAADTGAGGLSTNGDLLVMVNREASSVRIANTADGSFRQIDSVMPARLLSAYVIAVWASRLFLAALIVAILFYKAVKAVRERKMQGVGAAFGSVVVVLALGVAVGYVSYGSYQATFDVRNREINAFSDYLATQVIDLADSLSACEDRSVFRTNEANVVKAVDVLLAVNYKLDTLIDATTQNGIGMQCALYAKDEQGVYYVFDSALEHQATMSPDANDGLTAIEKAFEGDSDSPSAIHTVYDVREAIQYRLVPIPSADGSGVVGVVQIGSRMKTLAASAANNLVQQILIALVMVLVLYLTYSELRACGRCYLKYRTLKEAGDSDSTVMLTRLFSFSITMLSGIDAVMAVLIARELAGSSGMGDSGIVLALPVVMQGVGLALGQGVYGLLGSRVPLRRLMMGGGIAMLLCAAFVAIVVGLGNYWLYCAAKLFVTIPLGLLYTLTYSLPRSARDDAIRAEAAAGVKRTDTSAAALGTVLGGSVAQALGNAWVYVLVALAVLPLLVMVTCFFPKNGKPLEEEGAYSKNGLTGLRLLLTNPTTLAVAFLVLLPTTIAAGYKSFVFPLFSSNAGLNTVSINSLFVLGQLVVYVCINSIDAVEARYGKWRVSTLAIALLGVVFLLFSLNTTLVWAIVVIALVGVLGKSSDGWKAMWLRSAQYRGVPAGQATGYMFAARSVALIVQPMILGALLSMTDSVIVVVIGVICVLSSGLFALATRRTELPGT